jgi:DNA transformation protein
MATRCAGEPERRRTSLRVSAPFLAFALDQLEQSGGVRQLRPRPMFGGVGLYAEDVFFAILAGDELYLKGDASIRHDYEAAGARPFTPYADRPVTMSYWSVPAGVLEDRDALRQWTQRAVQLARYAVRERHSRRRNRPRRQAVST